jgi:hypothetical protein
VVKTERRKKRVSTGRQGNKTDTLAKPLREAADKISARGSI